jgi:aldose 1-epimerase
MTTAKTESGDHLGHPIVTLTSDNLRICLAPSIGGAISAFQVKTSDGGLIDLMRPMDATALAAGDVLGASCFPLTPFSNRLRHGEFTFEDQHIKLPLNSDGPHTEHGHGWQRVWQVEHQANDAATLLYRHAPDDWPFAYEMRQHFLLAGSELSVTLESHNTGTTAMPYGFGLHPYFVRTDECRLNAPVQGFWLVDDEVMPTQLVPVPAAANLTDGIRIRDVELDNAYSGWSGEAHISWPEYKLGLTMRASTPLRFLVVYVPKGEAYFCAEPVSNSTDAFNLSGTRSDTGMLILEPGNRIRATISFSVDIERD